MKSNKKWLLALCGLLLLPLTAQAGDWIEDQKGCKAWNPNPVPGESITWSGACKEGYATGRGIQIWFKNGKATGEKHEVEMQGGYHIKGISTFASGSRYEGGWVEGKKTGKGVYTWTEKNRNCGSGFCYKKYVGEWKDNKKTCGKTEFWSGDSYDGCFNEQEEMQGKTKFQLAEENQRYLRRDKCQHLYQGRVFERENFFGYLNYIVIGFSPNQGRATVKAEHNGSVTEILCRDIPD